MRNHNDFRGFNNFNSHDSFHRSFEQGMSFHKFFFGLVFILIVCSIGYQFIVAPTLTNEQFCRSPFAQNDMRCIGALSPHAPPTAVIVNPR